MELLRLENVSSTSNLSKAKPTRVIDSISFKVEGGEFVALIGPSGGGKTTLLRMLNRLDEIGGGEISLEGNPLQSFSPELLRRQISLLPQRSVMFPGTVFDNVMLPFRLQKLHEPDGLEAKGERILSSCGISSELHRRNALELSIGQQQRVALARSLVLEPKVLLADEPTSALDRPTANQVAQTLKKYVQDGCHSVLMVSHDLELISKYADRLVYLVSGKLVEQGKTRELLSNPSSESLRLFLENPESHENND